jgi:aspartate aminotransferase
MASGKYLDNIAQVDAYLSWIKEELQTRLNGFYQGITRLKDAGYPVQAIPPAAAIYLTVQFNLIGKKMANGDVLQTTGDVTAYLLNEAKVALVPFRAFGASDDSTWYRLSVGTASTSDVEASILAIESAMAKLV